MLKMAFNREPNGKQGIMWGAICCAVFLMKHEFGATASVLFLMHGSVIVADCWNAVAALQVACGLGLMA